MDSNGLSETRQNDESTSAFIDPWAAERRRIGQDLHDTLLQGFFGVSARLETAVQQLPPDPDVKPQFNDLVQMMRRILQEGRLSVQGLREQDRSPCSLGKALAGIPTQLGLSASTRFRVIVEGQPRELKPELGEEVYRIGREAIVNAYRHSCAKDIETLIAYRPSELNIAVCDNGCGIDPKDLPWGRNGRWGLLGMRDRAERIGARLRLLSRVALGTEVELCVPRRLAFNHS